MYPTRESVEQADRMQLAYWQRYLPSPGRSAVGRIDFDEVLERESMILNRIMDRFAELGGMTPEISKRIGWE